MDDKIAWWLVIVPSLPLAAALLTAILGPRLLRSRSHYLVILALLGAFVGSLMLFREVRSAQQQHTIAPAGSGYEHTVTLWTWAAVSPAEGADEALPGGSRDFRIGITLRADSLTCVMLLMVTLVSTLVAFFAAGYMHGDRAYWRFFTYFSLFVFSMTMLVSASNFVLLFVFWEAVGLCSYLLIGFWYEKPAAAAAGKKAFLVNRVGDLGFTLALFFIWTTYGTFNFHDSLRDGTTNLQEVAAASVGSGQADSAMVPGVLGRWRIASDNYATGTIGFAICALLLLGACGKSAQFPLHVWLPDAMEGPTPVSALIHAATMVTAGVYMIARCTPLFMVSASAQLLVACIGGGTALLAALIALTQHDLKRVLAYSTVSQLGYMLLGLGVGTFAGITAGMFHLFTHAFFKALLFLGAGSVMHAMGNVIDMRRFGGLRRRMPITHVTFFIGCLALAGFPGMAGFWSKDAIVAALHEKGHEAAPAAHLEQGHMPEGEQGAHPPARSISQSIQLPHPPQAGEIGVDEHAAYAAVYRLLYAVAMFTALLTALYTFRALFVTFYGRERIPHEAGDHAHESPPIMHWPLRILAIAAASLGFCLDQTWRREPNHLFAEFLSTTPSFADGAVAATKHPYAFHGNIAVTSGIVSIAGILLATYLYLGSQREVQWLKALCDFGPFSGDARKPAAGSRRFGWFGSLQQAAEKVGLAWLSDRMARAASLLVQVVSSPAWLGNFVSPYKLSYRKFFIDELYQTLLVLPLRGLAWLCYSLDRWLVDGLVNTIGRVPVAIGALIRSTQVGLIPIYALAMVLGTLLLIVARVLLAG